MGGTCLKDFTGIDPAAALFLSKICTFIRSCEEDELGGYGGRSSSRYLRQYLAGVLLLVEQHGFVSSGKAKLSGLQATYETASRLDHLFKDEPELRRIYDEQYDRLSSEADAIIQWYRTRECKDSFDLNVQALLARDVISHDRKHLAFAAAAVPSYQRHLARQAEEQAQQEKPSVHVGSIGEKVVAVLHLHRAFGFNTDYGRQYRINLRDKDGNHLSWRTSSPHDRLLETEAIGGSFEAQFKIKKHDQYNGSAVTEITHLKIREWAPNAAPTAVSS